MRWGKPEVSGKRPRRVQGEDEGHVWELSKEAEGLEEWKSYGDGFRGIAQVLCGRTSGKGAS